MSRMIPKGHEVAGLGRRFGAFVLDALPVLLIELVLTIVLQLSGGAAVTLVASLVSAMLILVYGLYQWWAYATIGSGLGARMLGLELVGLSDGKPLGWWRVFLRFLVYSGLMITGIGGIAMVIFLVVHERRQGWHDMATRSVVVQLRQVARPEKLPQERQRKNQVRMVGMPPHLAQPFSPELAQSSMGYYQSEHSSFSPQGSSDQFAAGPGHEAQPGFANATGQQHFTPAQHQPAAGGGFAGPDQSVGQPAVAGGGFGGAAGQPVFPASASGVGGFPSSGQSAPGGVAGQSGGGFAGPDQSVGQPSANAPATNNIPIPPIQPMQDFGDNPTRGNQPGWIPMPTPASVLESSSRPVKVRPREFGELEENDSTVIASPTQPDGGTEDRDWYIRLDDGREVDLTVTVLLGRNPQRKPEDPEVHLVPASGDGRMISRTHVLIGTDPRGVFIIDRGSTNGTALVQPTGKLEPAPPGVQMRVQEGQQVSYGNRWFTVLARPVAPK